MKLKLKILILTLVMVFGYAPALPAKAFYIEMPQILSDAIVTLKSLSVMAQEGSAMAPTVDTIFCDVLGRQTTREECSIPTSQQPGSNIIFCNVLGRQTTKDECGAAQQTQGVDNQQQDQPQQDNNQPMMNQQQQGTGQMMNGQGGGDNARFLKDAQKGAKQMERSLNQFDILLKITEKAGGTVKSEIKDEAEKLRGMLEMIKDSKSSEDLQDFDMGEANQIAQELEQYRRETQEQAQRLKQVKQQIRNAEQVVKSFEKQVAKAKNCVTDDVKIKLVTLKATITTVKNAKTWDEVESAGLDDMGDLFNDVNDSRDQLEICSRWPQILKQVDTQLKSLAKQLTKNKTLVAKLSIKGIDLSVPYSVFEAGITKMKAVREEAVEKMKSGDAQGAADLLQDDFYGQMDDVMQNQQTIQTMSNLGSFNSQFKIGLTGAQKQINSLKKQKINTSELVVILGEMKTKGAEILVLIKQKDVDLDTIMSEMENLQDLRSDFGNKVVELTGDEEMNMPGMLVKPQIQTLQMPTGLNQFMSQPQQMRQVQTTNPVGESNPQPSP